MDSSLHFKMLTFEGVWFLYRYSISKRGESRSGSNFGGHPTFLLMLPQFNPPDRAYMTSLSSQGPS